MTSVIQVFQIYFFEVTKGDLTEPESNARFYAATTVSALVVALIGPIIGGLADVSAKRKQIMAFFIGVGVAGTLGTAIARPESWAWSLFWYSVANVAVAVS